MDRYTILFALTRSGSLYAGVPQVDGAYRIRRFRPNGKPMELTFDGSLASVTGIDRSNPPSPEAIVACAGEAFQLRSDTFGAPELGHRMVAGRKDGHMEVSSSVVWTGRMSIDREWAIDAIFRAHRNHDPNWRDLLQEQSFEVGFESVREDSSGLTDSLRRDFYENWLAAKADRRDSYGRRNRPGEVRPRSVRVSNEHLERELRAAIGDDFQEVSLSEQTIVTRIRVAGRRRPYTLRTLDVEVAHRAVLADGLERYSVNVANRLTQLALPSFADALPRAA